MRYRWRIAALVFVLGFLWFVWPTRWQYASPPRLRVDRITGTVEYWSVDNGTWQINLQTDRNHRQ